MATVAARYHTIPKIRMLANPHPGALDARDCKSLPELYLRRVQATPSAIAISSPDTRKPDTAWTDETWSQDAVKTAQRVSLLRGRGFAPGDRLALFAPTNPEFRRLMMASMFLGGVAVPFADNSSVGKVDICLEDNAKEHLPSLPRFFYFGTSRWIAHVQGLRDGIHQFLERYPRMQALFMASEREIDRLGVSAAHRDRMLFIPDLLEAVKQQYSGYDLLEPLARHLNSDHQGLTLFTSGSSSGNKARLKPVPFSHRQIVDKTSQVTRIPGLPLLPSQRVFSAITYGHSIGINEWIASIAAGLHVSFLEGNLNRRKDWIATRKPHFLLAVPRLHIQMRNRIRATLKADKELKEKAGEPTERETKGLMAVRLAEGKTLGDRLLCRMFSRKLERLAFPPMREKLGGNVQMVLSGGGALPLSVGRFFRTAILPPGSRFGMKEGWGQTEGLGLQMLANGSVHQIGTLGRMLGDNEGRVNLETGEFEVRGPNIIPGYGYDLSAVRWTSPDPDWHLTGDIIGLERRWPWFWKLLPIFKGRADRMVKLSGGEKIYPEHIEALYTVDGLFSAALVVGGTIDSNDYLFTLVWPNREELGEALAAAGHSPDLLKQEGWEKNPLIYGLLNRRADEAVSGGRLAKFEKPKGILIIPDEPILSGPDKLAYGRIQETYEPEILRVAREQIARSKIR